MFYEVILGKVFGKGSGVLTYEYSDSLLPGQIVQVPLGRSKAVGVVYKKVVDSALYSDRIIYKNIILYLCDFMHWSQT